MTDLQPVVEPESSDWRGMLDAYERSAAVYSSEADCLDPLDERREFVVARGHEFLIAADKLRDEHRVALRHEGLVDEAMTNSARSLYAQSKRFGVSDIGGCRRYVQYLIADEEFTDPRGDYLAAYVGTEVGRGLERDYIALRNDKARAQIDALVPIEVVIDGEVFVINLPGHPDIVEPLEHGNTVIDYKTKDGLGVAIREDGELKHKFQVTLYAKALIHAGVIDDKARLALVYVDRSGSENAFHTVEWDYDEAIYEQAVEWLSDVVYAQHNGEEASKDMPRQWCESYCPFFTACRTYETDVQGVITDAHLLSAIDLYDEAHQRELAAKADKKSAAAELQGVAGYTPDGRSWRWIHVNEGKVESFVRRGYERASLTKPKKKR